MAAALLGVTGANADVLNDRYDQARTGMSFNFRGFQSISIE